jgi:hypothetical protein
MGLPSLWLFSFIAEVWPDADARSRLSASARRRGPAQARDERWQGDEQRRHQGDHEHLGQRVEHRSDVALRAAARRGQTDDDPEGPHQTDEEGWRDGEEAEPAQRLDGVQ